MNAVSLVLKNVESNCIYNKAFKKLLFVFMYKSYQCNPFLIVYTSILTIGYRTEPDYKSTANNNKNPV